MSESNGYPSAFIVDDGYTEEGYIAGVDRLYPPVRFSYRPMLTSERLQASSEGLKTKDDVQASQVMNRWLVRKLKSWDIAGDDGQLLPITAENVGRLKPRLRNRLLDIISGQEACDAPPEADEPPKPFDEGAAAKN